MGSTFGKIFKISTFGESHGGGLGVVIEGCPPKLELNLDEIQYELDRRKPGQSKITTQRKEEDKIEVMSGLNGNITLGTPIALMIRNTDQRPKDYQSMEKVFRPSHADATYQSKYGIQAPSGGGRASARETIGRVAAGAIAKQFLKKKFGSEILGWVKRIYDIDSEINLDIVNQKQIEANIVRCPDQIAAEKMIRKIEEIAKEGDSCGGVIECLVRKPPVGAGSPVFDKLDALLAQALMSLPATKGFEIGSGFGGTFLKGSEHNDPFVPGDNLRQYKTLSNNSGGIQGGISNGENIVMRIAFKPTATIRKEQQTINSLGESTKLQATGRHDPCVLPRAVPMVEAMVALVLADQMMINHAQCNIL
tara:strand:- start:18011 stop:19102 length:1092 start_codon:yes stop_codon:yes gene_type:complete